MSRKILVIAVAAMIAGITGARAQETYSNPVIRINCPDPTVLDDRGVSGWFWLYSTQTTVDGNVNKDSSPANDNGRQAGNLNTGEATNISGDEKVEGGNRVINLPIYRSKDLVHWEFVGDGFPDGRPAWVKDSKLWAPDINRFDGKYVLYYALGVWGGIFKEGSGVAVADSPAGPFIDKGKVVDYKSMGTLNSIDPNYFDDGGKRYLLWGSLGGGIDIVRLSDDGMSVYPKAKKKHVAARNMEGAYLYKREGKYYLFASKGTCCEGENSTYRLVVARADKPEGPYYGPDGQKFTSLGYDHVIMQGGENGRFAGPGHNAQIVTDRNGRDWMLFHSYWKENGYNGRCLMLEELHWDKDGWPYFLGGVPSTSAVAPVF